MSTLGDQLDLRQPLKQLAEQFPWVEFEQAFGKYYSADGRPAKSVRLMVGLLLLKQMFNQGDETVVAAWVQNPYWQYFCGMREFQWQVPCDPSDLVYFRQRIGEVGMQRILQVSAQLHGPAAQEKEVVVDTTVQEKNITHPTDTKLTYQIIRRCWKLADRNEVKLRRRYRKAVRQDVMAQRWRRDPQAQGGTPGIAEDEDHCRAVDSGTGAQAAGGREGGATGALCTVSASATPAAFGSEQDLLTARAAGVLRLQGQGTQAV